MFLTINLAEIAPPFIPEEETGTAPGIVPLEDVTIQSNGTGGGNWSSTSTWVGGVVPGAGDKVHIRSTDTVTYDANSTARIGWIRVDGTFQWDTSPSVTRRLYVGHLLGTSIGTIRVGTTTTPIPASSLAEIYIADLGDINIVEDPNLLGRSIMSLYVTEMHGAFKTPFVRLGADITAGASSITLAEAPTGWAVGDKILIAASRHEGWGWDGSKTAYRGHEDEVHEIASIAGTTVTLVGTVANARTGVTFIDTGGNMSTTTFRPHVANLSRNVRIATENVNETFPVHRRGHTMWMGSGASVDMRYVELYGLGRTDRRFPAIDPVVTPVTAATDNVVGRYAWHCHFMGTGKVKQKSPPVARGMTVWGPEHTTPVGEPNWAGSPGWGIVQHSSGSNWYQNVVYGALGSAYVSEDGSETGTWAENLAVWCSGRKAGTNPKGAESEDPTLIGVNGHGMFCVSRQVRAKGNYIASCNTGPAFFHRTGIDVPFGDWQIPPVLWATIGNSNTVENDKPPINHWDNNEIYGCHLAWIVVKASPKQGHEYWSFLSDNIAWNVIGGFEFEYTGRYTVKNSRIKAYASANRPAFSNLAIGIEFGGNTFEFMLNGVTVEGFTNGLVLEHLLIGAFPAPIGNDWGFRVINLDAANCTNAWPTFDATKGDVEYANEAALPGSAVSPPTLTYTAVDASPSITLTGTITDSAGSRPINSYENNPYSRTAIEKFLREYGYWSNGGVRTLFAPLIITDRPTGVHHAYGLQIDVSALSLGPYTNNGAWTTGSAPVRSAISTTASSGVNTTIDITSAATDADGDTVLILGTDRTSDAEVIDNGDGTLDYRSDFGFTGVDTFDCWIWDKKGNITKVPVTVTVS